ncbi:MAG: 2'-5' RNA ligase [Ignavibacteria bacterium GWB2_35_12]|nr:MAG: 2'-5' RNA ligase [Ignavibacteria bacterium GWA2_35_8]OGU40832.1 MAG: 2'-5' RNA ligase [Ignavibacteria bacterium GWB2_35_12]OGU87124.1 MAG: 2'-5' RNA ligase [Ignavibacteria bacterium RIFOXYA2_FULL_35_10]OGV24659.1 MAG: 2'-5' RNA ligase [Ignavibacteria bacterium RIFOXYC2_FULL_35_21]
MIYLHLFCFILKKSMETKRLFIGTFVAPSLFESKFKSVQYDFDTCCSGKWVELNNLHFTYQFLGNVETSQIDEFRNSLKDYLIDYQSKLSIKGLSVLPKPNFPKVLYMKIQNDDGIVLSAQKKMENILVSHGYKPEKRAFTPHVTLLRIKQFERNRFIETITKYQDFEIGIMDSFRIDMIESQLTKYGPIYRKI